MGKLSLITVIMFLVVAPALAEDVEFRSAKFEQSEREVRVKGQLYRPADTSPLPAVVLLQTCGGQTQHVTHDWPRYLVDSGYIVLSVDTLGSRGYHQGCRAMRDRFSAQARDAYGALNYLASQPYVDSQRIAVIGFSLGAITINELIMARVPNVTGTPEFSAFVSLYGRCRDMKPDGVRNAALLQVIAEKDHYVATCIERSKAIKMETLLLTGAYHAFDQPQITQIRPDPFGNPMLYDAAATERAREAVRAFLAKTWK